MMPKDADMEDISNRFDKFLKEKKKKMREPTFIPWLKNQWAPLSEEENQVLSDLQI
jgi:hypothetical protein